MEFIELAELCDKGSSNLAQKDLVYDSGIYPVYGAPGEITKVDFFHQSKPYLGLIKDGAGVGRVMQLPANSSVIGTIQYIFPKENIDLKYLYYLIKYLDLGKSNTGATIPHIYFKDYKKRKVKVREYSEQKHIGQILELIDSHLRTYKKVLEQYDLLIKSRFNELIIGDECDKLVFKDLFFCTTGKLDSNAAVKGGRYPFFTCAKEIFYINDYAFDQEALLLAGNNAAGKYDVKYYNGKFNAYQRTYILSLRKKGIYSIFKEQLEDKLKYLQSQSKGSTTRYLTMGILKKLTFLVPDMEIQLKLDKEIQQINKLKSDVQKSIDETQLLMDSLMQEYFG